MKKVMTSMIILALAVMVLIPVSCQNNKTPDTYDVLIKDGLVYDGSTSGPVVEDVGVRDDKIVAVGKNLTGSTRKIINAQGMIVTPGFIDVHNHTDISILMAWLVTGNAGDLSMITPEWKNNHNYLTQGVTTIVTGLCGGGFRDINQWLGLIDSVKFGSNVYHLIPYGMVRNQLFGDNQPTTLTTQQLDSLKKIVEKEMQSGALGISVGLEYAPDCFTTTDELVEISKVVKKYGGLYVAHIRDQTGTMHKNGLPGVINSIKETIEIGKRADIPVHISHIQLNLPWGNVQAKQMYGLIEQARAEGVDITADQHPYDQGYGIISYRLPDKFKTGLGVNKKYKTPEGKAEMKNETKRIFRFLGPEKIMLISGPEKYHNKTIREIAEMERKSPAEVYVDLSCLEPAPFALFHEINDQINREIMPHDYVFTASDGFAVFAPADSPHPRFFGCFPYKIRKYSLEEKLMSLNDVIRSMTSLPAAKFKLKGRGTIVVGNYADIAVIALNKLKEKADYINRGVYSEGVMYLLVNGQISVDQGKLTGKRGGQSGRL